MTIPSSQEAAFHVDREHRGVRFAVLLLLLFSFIISYAVASYVVRSLFPQLNTVVILSCLAAIPVALLISAGGEWLLKREWHSGRTLTVDEQRFVLHRPGQEDQAIDRGRAYDEMWWQISLAGYARGGRERRIPARWSCMAGQFQQDDARIVVFCYAPPQRREQWLEQYTFVKLRPEEVYNTSFSSRMGSPSRPEIPPEVIAGKHGRTWLAERNRWREGVEMTPEDFERFLELSYSTGAY